MRVSGLFVITLLLSLSACQVPVRDSTQPICLWVAKGYSNTVYLLGSIHVGSPAMYPLPQPMMDAFEHSPNLVVELNILNVDRKEILKSAFYPLGQNLKKDLPPALYRQVLDKIKPYHLTPLMINRMRPWMVGMTLEGLALNDSGFDNSLGIDYHFLSLAEDKNIIELETVDEQMSVFNTLSKKEQIAYLKSSLQEPVSKKKLLNQLIQAWNEGNTALIARFYNPRSMKDNPQLYDNLLVSRNSRMADKIREFLNGSEDYLVIVGVAHFSGPGSVIDILSREGYDIQQVRIQP